MSRLLPLPCCNPRNMKWRDADVSYPSNLPFRCRCPSFAVIIKSRYYKGFAFACCRVRKLIGPIPLEECLFFFFINEVRHRFPTINNSVGMPCQVMSTVKREMNILISNDKTVSGQDNNRNFWFRGSPRFCPPSLGSLVQK